MKHKLIYLVIIVESVCHVAQAVTPTTIAFGGASQGFVYMYDYASGNMTTVSTNLTGRVANIVKINESVIAVGIMSPMQLSFINTTSMSFISRVGTGHSNTINSISYDPDSKMLLSMANDGLIKVWNMTGNIQLVRNHAAGAGGVWHTIWLQLPSGKAVSCHSTNLVQIWDPPTGTIYMNITTSARIYWIDQLDSETLAGAATSTNIFLWSLINGSQVASLPTAASNRYVALWAPNLMVTADIAGSVYIWNWANRTCLTTIRAYNTSIWRLAITQDSILFPATINYTLVPHFNISGTGQATNFQNFTFPEGLYSAMAFYPYKPIIMPSNPNYVMVGGENSVISTFDLKTQFVSAQINLNCGRIGTVLRINSSVYAVSCYQFKVGFINIDTMTLISVITTNLTINQMNIAYVKKSNVLVIGGQSGLTQVWSMDTLTLLYIYTGYVGNSVQFVIALENGNIALCGVSAIMIWQWPAGQTLNTVYYGAQCNGLAQVTTTLIAAGGNNNNVKVISMFDGSIYATLSALSIVTHVMLFGPNMIVSADCVGGLRVFNWRTSTLLSSQQAAACTCTYYPSITFDMILVAVCPSNTFSINYNLSSSGAQTLIGQGYTFPNTLFSSAALNPYVSNVTTYSIDSTKLVVGSSSGSILLFNIMNGSIIDTVYGLGTGTINSLVYVNSSVIAAGSSDAKVFICTTEFDPIKVITTGHTTSITTMLLASTQVLVTCSADFTCKVWNLTSYQLMLNYTQHTAAINGMFLLNNGLIASFASGVLKIWQWSTGTTSTTITNPYTIRSASQISKDLVATGDENYQIKLWYMANGTLYKTVGSMTSGVTAIQLFSAEILLTNDYSGNMYLWWWQNSTQLSSRTGMLNGWTSSLSVTRSGNVIGVSSSNGLTYGSVSSGSYSQIWTASNPQYSVLPVDYFQSAPWLFIYNKNSDPANPLQLNRSTTYTFSCSSLFASPFPYSTSLQWTVYNLDPTTYSILSQISFSTYNPTQTEQDFILPGNTLSFGLFKAVVTVNVSVDSMSTQLSAQDTTYFKVVPTGISVIALANSVTSLTVGSLQGLTLSPASYSIDKDSFVSISSLSFKFYCRLVNSTQTGVNYLLSDPTATDLNTGLGLNTCFNSTSSYAFNQSGNNLIVLPGGFRYSASESSQFVISTTSSGFTYYQVINVNINPQVSQLPIPVINCRVASFCLTFGSVKIFSTSNILILDGSYNQVDYVDSSQVLWKVYKNTGNFTNPIWSSLTASETSNLDGLSTNELTISSNLFSSSILQYQVDFTLTTTSRTISSLNASFVGSMILQANQKPYNGSCSVDLTSGLALSTNFTITCANWADYDGIVTKYEFFATYLNNVSTVNLGNNQTGFFYTTLPAGSTSDSDRLYIFVQIFDNSGAITAYYITTPIQVVMQTSTLFSAQSDILSGSANNPLVQSMNSPDLSVASSAIIAYASSFNQVASNSSNASSVDVSLAQQVNTMFVDSISNYDMTDLSSIKAASSVLSVVSENPELLSPSTAEKINNLCSEMTQNLLLNSNQYSLSYIYQAASYILDASANSVQSLNQQSESSSTLKNAASQQMSLIETITSVTVNQLPLNGSQNVNKKNINLTITRTTMDNVQTDLTTSGSSLKLANPCSIVNLPAGNCSNKVVVAQMYSRTNSLVLNDEVKTKDSTSISLSYYDNNMNEYDVSGRSSADSFYFWIYKSTQVAASFEVVNMSNYSVEAQKNQLWSAGIQLTTSNQSITIQIMPTGSNKNSIGYLVCLKYGAGCVINSTWQSFDILRVFCPSDFVSEAGKSFYKLFSNMSANINSASTVGYGFRQLTQNEYNDYCSGTVRLLTQAPVLDEQLYNITSLLSSPVSKLVYAAGCYYIDKSSLSYSSWGMEVLSDSNTTHTHCVASHLTEFAGGMVVLPDSIDFNNVWSKAGSFTANLTIYLTVIIVCSLYILLFVWCRWMDWRDGKKRSIFLLADNSPVDEYFYELIVFTGTRKDAGTKSRVTFVLAGSETQTECRRLRPEENKAIILERGSVNSLLMSTKLPLGDLRFMRIWHDNSGPGRTASWFLKFIIVHDLQTREKFYFICNDWLAVDKSDGLIERILPVATNKQKTDLTYLLEKQTKQRLSDGHLWFSIVARPPESAFSRTDRLTCAFVLLCLAMFMNIMYYGVASSSPSKNDLNIGPFSLSQTQVVIGVISNLVIFPISFLILQMFRKSRRRVSRSERIKKQIAKNQTQRDPMNRNSSPSAENQSKRRFKKPNKKFTLPWWFKIIAHVLSFCVATVCIFFIFLKGVSFGDDTCRKWLASFLISVLTSIFFTQPLQVALLSIFFVLLFRKSNDDQDLEYDHSDDGKPINKVNIKARPASDSAETNQAYSLESMNNNHILEEMKQKRLMEKKAWSAMRVILVNAIFLTVLFQVAYSKTNPNSYLYQTKLQQLLVQNITLIHTPDDIWSWINNQFVYSLSSSKWYNQQDSSVSGYLSDFNSYLVDYVMLRQARSKSANCSLITGNSVCYSDYGVSNYEHTDYGLDWTSYTSSMTTPPSVSVHKAFQYSSAMSIDSQPYAGQYKNYLGGGYVFNIDASSQNVSQIQSELDSLQKNDWIDRQTRALFIEFTVYNVNLDLFAYCLVLFEILPTGSIESSFEINPMSLYTDDSLVIVAFDIIYMFIVVFLMVRELQLIIKLKRKYLKHWWSYINWLLIIFSWVSFAMYLYRMYEKWRLTSKISAKNGQVINFQLIQYWNSLMLMFLGACCFLGSVRLLKVFSFSRNISMLGRVFRQVFKEMIGFMLIFLVLIFAFTQMMFLMANDRNFQFQSFARSLVTGFLMIIGKFNVDSFCQDVGIVGPIVYCGFTLLIALVLLNMFITLLTDKFSQIRKEMKEIEGEEDSLIVQYFKTSVWPSMISQFKSIKGNREKYQVESPDYKDTYQVLAIKTDKLTYFVNDQAQMHKRLNK